MRIRIQLTISAFKFIFCIWALGKADKYLGA
jgi:hypothetical protein